MIVRWRAGKGVCWERESGGERVEKLKVILFANLS